MYTILVTHRTCHANKLEKASFVQILDTPSGAAMNYKCLLSGMVKDLQIGCKKELMKIVRCQTPANLPSLVGDVLVVGEASLDPVVDLAQGHAHVGVAAERHLDEIHVGVGRALGHPLRRPILHSSAPSPPLAAAPSAPLNDTKQAFQINGIQRGLL